MLTKSATIVVLLACLLSGCDDDDDSESGSSGHDPGGSSSAGPCTSPTDVQLTVRAQTDDEVEYLDQIDACTNAEATVTWLNNRSDLVWVPSVDGGATASGISTTASTFAAAVGRDEVLLVPDTDLTVEAAPARVEWTYDLGLSTAWEARDILMDWAIANGLEAAFNNPKSQVAAAVATCLVAVKATIDAQQDAIVNGQFQPSDAIVGTLGAGTSAVTCIDRLRAAHAATNFQSPAMTLSERLPWLEQADNILSKAARVQRYGNLLLKSL